MIPIDPGGDGELVTFAADQQEYNPLPARRDLEGRVATRWQLTNDERRSLCAGADIVLELLTFNQPLQPILIEVADPNVGATCPHCGVQWRATIGERYRDGDGYITRSYLCGTSIRTSTDEGFTDADNQTADCLRRELAAEPA